MSTTSPIIRLELSQQYPMIHFQYTQGAEERYACLRASEVKPKLDRFLLHLLGSEAEDSSLFVGDRKHPALDYKMSISLPTGASCTSKNPDKTYFANMVEKDQNKKVKMVEWKDSDGIAAVVKLVCFNPRVRQLLSKENLSDFFICTNFGRRSGKGFGSFLLSSYNGERIAVPTDEGIGRSLHRGYKVSAYYQLDNPSRKQPMELVQDVYTRMKSGVNNNAQDYTRSYFFQYCHRFGICNEKAAVKVRGISPRNKDGAPYARYHLAQTEADPNAEYRYVRALLGVGAAMVFQTAQGSRETIAIKSKKELLDRFPSPLLFKIIDRKVYLIPLRVDDFIFGKTFLFQNKTTRSLTELNTPKKDEFFGDFDLDDFLQYCAKDDPNRVNSEKKLFTRVEIGGRRKGV